MPNNYFYKTRAKIWHEFLQYCDQKDCSIQKHGISADLLFNFIEKGSNDTYVTSNDAKTRSNHLKSCIREYISPSNLTIKTAYLADIFLENIDKRIKNSKNYRALNNIKFKRFSPLNLRHFFNLVTEFFNEPDGKNKILIAATIIQISGSIRVSNLLPKISGESYCLSKDSFNLDLSNLSKIDLKTDYQLRFVQSKTGGGIIPYSRLGIYAAYYLHNVYKDKKWLNDISYSKYTKFLRSKLGQNVQTHDLRRLIPTYAGELLEENPKYYKTLKSIGNWKSHTSADIYAKTSNSILSAIYDQFLIFFSQQNGGKIVK